MHYTSLVSGQAFSETYGGEGKIVVDIGGLNVNGTLRNFFTEKGMSYISVDIEEHPSVDVVVKPGDKMPFENNSVDLIISTSCFEHDPCFWLTFKELTRIVKTGGFIYMSAPSSGLYHPFPGDYWRFYPDAGQALAYWSGVQISNEDIHPVKVVETFNVEGDNFYDFVCVWVKVEEKETSIIISPDVKNDLGVLECKIHSKGLYTRKQWK